jgi:hypothetical protein
MADRRILKIGLENQATSVVSENLVYGCDPTRPQTWRFHLTDGGSWSGSITVKGRAYGTTETFVAIPYRKQYVAGAVADDSVVSAALTAVPAIITVAADGLDVSLDHTRSAGTLEVAAFVVEA